MSRDRYCCNGTAVSSHKCISMSMTLSHISRLAHKWFFYLTGTFESKPPATISYSNSNMIPRLSLWLHRYPLWWNIHLDRKLLKFVTARFVVCDYPAFLEASLESISSSELLFPSFHSSVLPDLIGSKF